MTKLIGYARVSIRQQADLLAAGVRRDDLYIDHGVSGARASRPQFDQALDDEHGPATRYWWA
jgi:DNA invertase Pin-like site-specific DNA recombinase